MKGLDAALPASQAVAPDPTLKDRIRRGAVVLLWVVVAMLTGLAVVSLVLMQREHAEIREIFAERIPPDASEMEVIAAARSFFEHEVGYQRPDLYFLSPAFSFMRPTALQVIENGGDCAYRTRAFIVALRLFGVEASKIALHDDAGVPVHAVAEVRVDGGPYYVDMLFNVVHLDEHGRPLTLAELQDDRVLRASIERAVAAGNWRAEEYPLEVYDFEDWRTINWEKNGLLSAAYDGLVAVLGPERARSIPRPYLSEEPALMVVVLCMGGTVVCLVLIWGVGRLGAPAARARA